MSWPKTLPFRTLLFLLLPAASLAQPATAPDCARSRDPARCIALQGAHEACKDTRGAERRACLAAQHVPVDCSKARQPKRCEAKQAAKEACQGQSGTALRRCLKGRGG